MQHKFLWAFSLVFLATLSKSFPTSSDDDDDERDLEEIIADGKDTFRSIPDPSKASDSNVNCDLTQYTDEEGDGSDVISALSGVLESANINLGGTWRRFDISYPKDDRAKPTHFDCGYNAAGAIVYMDIVRDQENLGPYSAADVTWAKYRSVVDDEIKGGTPGQNDYSNVKYLIHTDVQSDDSEEVFNEFCGDQEEVMTYEPGTKGFNAVMGLANGAVTASLLKYHNVQMGRKKIKSISLFITKEGQVHLWFTLERALATVPSSTNKSFLDMKIKEQVMQRLLMLIL